MTIVSFDLWGTLIQRTCVLEDEVAAALGYPSQVVRERWYDIWFRQPLSIDAFLASFPAIGHNRRLNAKSLLLDAVARTKLLSSAAWPVLHALKSNPDVRLEMISDCDPMTPPAIHALQIEPHFNRIWLSFQHGRTKQFGLYDKVAEECRRERHRWLAHIGDNPYFDGELVCGHGVQPFVIEHSIRTSNLSTAVLDFIYASMGKDIP